jgi:hypothetical protein
MINENTFKDFDDSKFSLPGEKKDDASKNTDTKADESTLNLDEDDDAAKGGAGEEGQDDQGDAGKQGLDNSDESQEKEKDNDEAGKEDTQELTPEEIEPLIEQYFEGKIKGFDGIKNLLSENERLSKELENKELTFPSERAKALYEFAVKADGYELDTARNYLHILSLDLTKLDAKEKQYEAFKLERPDLAPEKARKIFDAKYEKLYGEGFEEDAVLQDEHELATRKAEATLKKAQEDFNNAKGKSQEPADDVELNNAIAKFQTDVEKEFGDFGGIQMSYDGSDSPLNFDLSPQEEQEFLKIAKNPSLLAQELVESCIDPKTKAVDYQQFLTELYIRRNAHKLIQESQKHGFKLGELSVINGRLKNSQGDGKNKGGGNAPPATKKSFEEAFADAVGGK